MLVNENSIVLVNSNNRVLINEPINEFLGTVNNLWSNPGNWSLGVLPTSNSIAIISANCLKNDFPSYTVRQLRIGAGVTLDITVGSMISTEIFFNDGQVNAANLVLYGLFSAQKIGNVTYTGGTNQFAFTDEYNFPSTVTLTGGEFRLVQGIVNFTYNITFPARLYLPPYGTPQVTMKLANGVSVAALGNLDIDIGMNNRLQLATNAKLVSVSALSINALNILSDIGSEIEAKGNNVRIVASNPNLTLPGKLVLSTIDKNIEINNNAAIQSIEIRGIAVNFVYINIIQGFLQISEIVATTGLSTWNNKSFLRVRAINNFMPVGLFNADFENSVVSYDLAGNQDIRTTDDARYRQLRLETSGTKKLVGNIVCEHLYLAGTVSLDLNGFSLTGYTMFTDVRSLNTTLPSGTFLDFTIANNTKTLSGNLSLTNLFQIGSCTVALSGFTITTVNAYNRSNSSLSISPSNVSATNWFYDLSGTQVVNGGTYNNLTLANGSTKTLLGNIVVNGTYTRVGTWVINKNGFTIKDSLGNDLE